ncbi:MAG: hypothetical protein Q9170_007883 [Blastenia crenularia]
MAFEPDKPDKRARPKSTASVDHEELKALHTRQKLNHFDQSTSNISLPEVRRRLGRKIVRTYDRKPFIPVPSIKAFWATELEVQDFLTNIECATHPVHAILTKSLRVFSAMVLVEWGSDQHFRDLFYRIYSDNTNPLWKDDSLMVASHPGWDFSGLDLDEANSLESAIDLVSVPVLELSKESKPFRQHTTLPITSKHEIGQGAYGKVYEIKLAEGCLMFENTGGSTSSNKAEERFALKEMNDASESQRELDFLRRYRENSRKSNHIVVHLAIIERGSEASVIYPLATGDLQKLLEGKLDSYQWVDGDTEQFRGVIKISCDLADGLDFLHRAMHDYTSLVCRHGDLKPDNFLLFSDGWKISDMGLARVKTISDNESGVKKTTKTTPKNGGGPYAAPEMSGPDLIGRETDVWSLAAIIMELIIWGLGGQEAWSNFVRRREVSSNGLFHNKTTLSRAVDEELRSWPEVHCGKISKFLGEDTTQASHFLKALTQALRAGFKIDPKSRAKSKEFRNSMDNVYGYFEHPQKGKREMMNFNSLQIRPQPLNTAWEALQRKFEEHRRAEIFRPEYFKPNEQTRVSNETQHDIQRWIEQPTPSALCVLTGTDNAWLSVSAITHEVYYTARFMGYEVVEFLTLNRYGRAATSSQASLDLVHCFIVQFLKAKPSDQLEAYSLDSLAIEDKLLPDEVKFESAVRVLGLVIETLAQDRQSKPVIIIVDEFWQVCARAALAKMRQQWEILFGLLGCGRISAGRPVVAPNFRILVRASGWLGDLKELGFEGTVCIPSPSEKHNFQTLGNTLEDILRNAE